ncbi:MAG TPA: hypothetical protein VMT17_09425 [Anaeromyxobacteraceae bacterium]|nr:hypothetical protein [Anaeromyxobacteraceae bacterium]
MGRAGTLAVAGEATVLGGLRSRLAGTSGRDALLLDFLEDDLAEGRRALREVATWLDRAERALDDGATGRQALLAIALSRGPDEGIERLAGAVGNLRRRIAQVSARLSR